jgi:hypothetical protein
MRTVPDRSNFVIAALVAATAGLAGASALAQRADPVPKVDKVEVEWPDPDIGRVALGRMQSETATAFREPLPFDQQKLSGVNVPVYVPKQALALTGLTFNSAADGDQYVLGGKARDLKVTIVGSRIVGQAPPESPSNAAFAAPPAPVRSETGISLGLSKNGVPYTITVECRRPQQDPRCTKPDYIRSLADSMEFVGGRGRQ